MSSILVIADLHLDQERPDITQCFFEFLLSAKEHQHQALYILGDLFEAWIGDDDITEFTKSVANAIHDFSIHTPVYFIHGNRDFLLGKKYAKTCGMTLLPEQYAINAFGKEILFMHGDQLCLDDVPYQKFRKKSRSWWWQAILLSLPLSFRKKKAQSMREQSKKSQMTKAADIMDVAHREVTRVMLETNCQLLIHGHTHRPKVHSLGNDKQRIVVGDWYTQGSVLTLNEQGAALHSLEFKK